MVGEAEAMTLNAHVVRRSVLGFAVMFGLLLTGRPAAAQKVLGIFGSGKVQYKVFKDAAGRFEIEYPTKDWNTLPTGGSAVAIVASKDRAATVLIDLSKLAGAIAAEEVPINHKIELQTLKDQNPSAKDFTDEIVDSKAGVKASMIRYLRVGSNGPERVMHFTVGIGLELYRLDAVVSEVSKAKYEEILKYMLLSFKAPAGPAGSKD
jgi:hypothetical protein